MTVSVGIPFYNNEQTILLAIRSVFAQTYGDWELILLDDGSTDGSARIASSIRDPRVAVVSDGVNRGLQYRLNQISRLASGQYLARMDADDIMHPDRLTCQVRLLEGDPSVDAVGTAAYTIDAVNNPVGLRGNASVDSRPRSILKSGLFIHPSVTGRTRWFRDNPYDESFTLAEDYELWWLTCRSSSSAVIRQPLVYYRENAGPCGAYLKYYLEDKRAQRRIFATYGPSTVGRVHTALFLLQTRLKGQIYRAATLFGAQAALVRSRSRRLTRVERTEALDGLNIVTNTPLPGMTADVRG